MDTNKKNAIWIVCDQMPAHMLGYMGDPNVHTPNIDILARTGVTFKRAVSGFPLCCPFRGSMLTSKYPHECVPGHEYQMPTNQKTIAHVFNENGYDTAYFGKWHLDGHKEKDSRAAKHIIPPERRGGFKRWMAYENNNSQWDTWVHGEENGEPFLRRLPKYETDALTDEFIKYIEEKAENKDQPFFAVLSVQPPHNPYVAPSENMKNYSPAKIKLRKNVPDISWVKEEAQRDLAGAYAMIENLDDNVGRIWRKLLDTGLLFDTHIIFFSDHGDMHGSQGRVRKTNPFQEAIHIPFIISGEQPWYDGRLSFDTDILTNHEIIAPGSTIKPPSLKDIIINHVDIAPTTLGLCGIKKPDYMDGNDYSDVRRAGVPRYEVPDCAYLQSVIPTGHAETIDKPWRGIVTNDGWKYVCFEGIEWLMFNLNDDPYEQMNLAHDLKYKGKRKELNDKLKGFIEKTNDKFELPNY